MRLKWKKLVATFLLLLLGGVVISGSVDEYGAVYADKGFKRALVTFAVARGLNGVISVAQGTEVAVQPAGVGINFTPGEILDPINDLVERFSWIMLASTTSLGLQKLLLGIFASDAFNGVIVAALLFALLALWYWGRQPVWLRPLAWRIAMALLILRFAIPVAALAGEGVFILFLEEPYSASTQQLERTTEEIARVNRQSTAEPLAEAEESLLGRARRLVGDAAASMDIPAYIDRYQSVAAEASEHAINLIVIFILQTILIPLFLLWLLVRMLKRVMRLEKFFWLS